MAEEDRDFYGMIKGVRSLWTEKMFLDYTIEVEDQEFKVHKIIMASVSDYFKAMLTGGMAESQTDRVRLEGLSPLAVSNMIQVVYTGEFGSDKADIEELVACAMYLQVPGLIGDCRTRLSEEITPQNSFELLSMLQTYSATDAIEETVEYITSHFEEVYKAWKPSEMTYTDIKNLVDLWQKSEWDLFLAIKHWVDVDVESHEQYLDELMKHVRFGLMTPEQLDVITVSDLYSGTESLWCENVDKALQYHDMPTHAKILHDSKQCKVRDDPLPFYFNRHLKEYYKLRKITTLGLQPQSPKRTETWQECEGLETPRMRNGVETFVVVNNFLIVCERYSTQQQWHVFDPRTRRWSSMAGLQTRRWESALVHCNKQLYVVGGCTDWPCDSTIATDIIERYDFKTNSWSIIPSKLPHPVYEHGAAVIDDCIYIAGGLVSGTEELSTRLDCFDTSTGTWHSKASLPKAHRGFRAIQVMEYHYEEVLFIMRYLQIQYYSPAQDQWFMWDCDQSVRHGSSGLQWHSNATVLSDQKNTLFLLKFMDRQVQYLPYIQLPYNSDDSDVEDHHYRNTDLCILCRKWSVSSEGQEIVQDWLEPFPETPYKGKEYHRKFTKLMLLALPPEPTASLSML